MSSRAVEAAHQLAESLDDGTLIPSRELMESLSALNGAIARWAQRENIPLKLINTKHRRLT